MAQLAETGSGSIQGRVRLTSRVRGAPLRSNAYQPRAVRPHAAAPGPEIKNVVVYLKGVASRTPPAPERSEIRQENETFIPRVLTVTAGSTVDFPNADPFYHNVFSLSNAATFDLGQFPQGRMRSQVLRKTGLVKVYCRIHSHMTASILVLNHPHFAVPNTDGTFTLTEVPPGVHTIVSWHERIGERAAAVHVAAGQAASIELSLPVESPLDPEDR